MNFIIQLLQKLAAQSSNLRVLIFGKTIAIRVTVIGLLVGFVAVVWSVFTAASAALYYIMPEPLSIAASWVVPDNFSTIMTTYVSCYTALAIYKWQKHYLQIPLF